MWCLNTFINDNGKNSRNMGYHATTVDVNPLTGRHRAAAVASLQDVILAQLQVAVARAEYNVIKSPVAVLISSDSQDIHKARWECLLYSLIEYRYHGFKLFIDGFFYVLIRPDAG